MIVDINVSLAYEVAEPVDLVLQMRAPSFADQRLIMETFDIGTPEHVTETAAEAGLGARTLIRTSEDFRSIYAARVKIDRPTLDITALDMVPVHLLPGDIVRYLMPSRYCPSDELQSFVASEFGHLSAGQKIKAMRDWIFERFDYRPGSSNAQTTAVDTFVQRQGVCRDFAHVLVTLARASAIPARFASVYAPHVTPQDFHAVAEVYLGGTWHLIDSTGMADASEIVRIGVGLDAAEVAFLTSFGPISMTEKSISVTILEP
ncbi:transglutaminase family protein [Gymnodinialimonas sp. 2305UL16-5]|uniref:transglutaminase-like domain-containing protein n=1 Tax=Gymnodinialimonas mytili TaxID=3126503 RepID=UPI0030A11B4D